MQQLSTVPTVAVVICTFNRNEALTTLLNALIACSLRLKDRARVGVVIVDDSKDGKAKPVADRFQDQFELGVTYRFSGRKNISLARNIAIATGAELADWVAMTDDDCEPVPEWLEELFLLQQRTGVGAVTGPMKRRVPKESPRWLVDEPFLELGHGQHDDGAELTFASTFNTLISSDWVKRHPQTRFQPALGNIGGEDMVFFRSAYAEGLRIRYSAKACVYENEPPSRANFRYQMRLFFWHGNSSYVTTVGSGGTPFRAFLHGLNSLRKAVARPVVRLSRGETPQLRYCLALVLHSFGKIVGPFGVRVRHR